MHSDTSSIPPDRGADEQGADALTEPLQFRLRPDEARRFALAAKRHGAGSTSAQARVLVREWLRSLPAGAAEDIAA